ncbi:MAG: histidine phosphatase family protein [Candidatus Paceibacter sp.]|jgi:broad specificity phosphatase PhoE|nr:histidine phosphatase family protein [Candidatus Paceibacter sp.]
MYGVCVPELTLVRHGQSLLNVAKAHSPIFFDDSAERDKFLAIPDHLVPLTEHGIVQARETGIALRELDVEYDLAIDSGYKRTVETLDHILEAYPEHKRKLIERFSDIHLRERDCGYTYSMTRGEVEAQFPWLQDYWKMRGPIFAQPVGGESIADVIQRVAHFLFVFGRNHTHKRVIIALHGRVLAAMRHLLEGWTYEQLEKFVRQGDHKNCGVTRYVYDDNTHKMRLVEYNTCHYTNPTI